MDAWRAGTRPETVVDVALALAAAGVNAVFALFPDNEDAYGLRTGPPLVVAGVVGGLVLVARRRHPLLTCLVVLALTDLVTVLRGDPGGLPFTVLLATYALGAHGSTRQGAVGLALAGSGFALLFAVQAPYFDSIISVAVLGQVMLAWVLGRLVARRRRIAEDARRRELALTRDGARATERAVLAERLRVARDLNDAAGDAIATITVRAAGARSSEVDPQGVLATIERSSRAATDDVRRMLLALRDPAATPVLDDSDPELRRALVTATGWDDEASDRAVRRARGRRDWPVDVALGLGVAVLNVTGSVAPDPSDPRTYADTVMPLLVLLAAVPGLALIIRRRHPVVTLALAAGAVAVVEALSWRTGNMPAALLIATYALGAWTTVPKGLITLVGLHAAMGLAAAAGPARFEAVGLLLFTVPWVLGAVIRWRRLADQQQVERALAAERELAVATERALAEERLAVARDLHDLVSHNLAAITLQAAAARRRPGSPDTTALAAIEQAGRSAVRDLRAMLDTLAQPLGGPLAPAPGLRDLEALAARHGEVNGPVELEIDPALERAPDSARLTAYRVVQEALTNVCRHAPGARVSVRLAATDGAVVVDVENDPLGSNLPVSPGSGYGLAGMRERVSLFGGTVTAGATPAGGFAVHAELSHGAT